MALIRLASPQWAYDTVTKELVIRFVEAAPDDWSSNTEYMPTRAAILRVPIPANVQIVQLPT